MARWYAPRIPVVYGVLAGCAVLLAGMSMHAQASRTLTIIVDGVGTTIPAGAPGTGVSYQYDDASSAQVQALWGKRGWAFSHWTGDIGTENPQSTELTLYMDRERTITAHYALAVYSLTLAVSGAGNTEPQPGAYGFLSGRTASFQRVLMTGGEAFAGWTGDLAEDAVLADEAQQVVMDRNRSVTAAFTTGDWILTVNPITGTGTGVLTPAAGVYAYFSGQRTSVKAALDTGMYWGGWTGDLDTFEFTGELLMDGNKTVTPMISSSGYPLTVTTSDYWLGRTSPSGTINIAAKAVLTVRALPWFAGYFQEWTGNVPAGADPQSPDIEISMDQERTLNAVFGEKDWYLYLQCQGNGNTSPAPQMWWYRDGETETLTALPAQGALFVRWEGVRPEEGDETSQTITVLMDEDRIITALFVPEEVRVPDLTGMTQLAAQNELVNAGLQLGTVSSSYSNEMSQGAVSGQTPPAGAVSPYQGFVDITLSLGPFPPEGEGGADVYHAADVNADNRISLYELLRVIQLFNNRGYHCAVVRETEDGYEPGYGIFHDCALHSSDYQPMDWIVSLPELLRLVQLFYTGSYYGCPEEETEDGFCLGPLAE